MLYGHVKKATVRFLLLPNTENQVQSGVLSGANTMRKMRVILAILGASVPFSAPVSAYFQSDSLETEAAASIGSPAEDTSQADTPLAVDETLSQPQLSVDQSALAVIPALYPVKIRVLDGINSKENQRGEFFRIELAEAIIIDGRELVPVGATGEGQIVHAAKARAAGKGGELILAARYIEHGGTRIDLRSFNWGDAGKDNMTVALVASSALSFAGYFISGGNVTIQPGMIGDAKIRNDTQIEYGQDETKHPADGAVASEAIAAEADDQSGANAANNQTVE